MAIFDRSWYRNLLDEVVDGNLNEQDLEKAYTDIRSFERQLRDSGTVIFKFFLDISKKEQAQRLQALREKIQTLPGGLMMAFSRGIINTTSIRQASKEMFKETDVVDGAHWQEIDTTKFLTGHGLSLCKSWSIFLRNKVEKTKKGGIKFNRNIPSAELTSLVRLPLPCARVDTSLSLGKDEYRKKLITRQKKIHELHNELYRSAYSHGHCL